jgi:hypothetical protein
MELRAQNQSEEFYGEERVISLLHNWESTHPELFEMHSFHMFMNSLVVTLRSMTSR